MKSTLPPAAHTHSLSAMAPFGFLYGRVELIEPRWREGRKEGCKRLFFHQPEATPAGEKTNLFLAHLASWRFKAASLVIFHAFGVNGLHGNFVVKRKGKINRMYSLELLP